MKYDNKTAAEFNASPVGHGLSLKRTGTAVKMFFNINRTTLNATMELVEMYLHCHRISMDGINDLGQLVLAVSQTAAKTTLAAAALNAAGQPVSPSLEALARAIMEKSRIFDMPMPAALVGKLKREGMSFPR
jgi:hypothetical protein